MSAAATQVQLRRGNTAQNAAFTGAVGEVTVNTDTNQLIVHDGVTVGGFTVGTGGAVTGGNYGGAAPNFTPDTAFAIAIDTFNGRNWTFYSGTWH